MEFRDLNSSSGYHQQPPPHLYESLATHHVSQHQPTSAPPHSSASSSSLPYYQNPNPNPNPYPSSENSLPIPSSATAAASAVRPPGTDPNPHDPYGYSLLPYYGAGTHSIPSQPYTDQSADYYYQHPQQQQYGVDSFTYGVVGCGNPSAVLETKKQKVIAGGAPPNSVRICTICNIVCNSDKVFAFHLAGEKHAFKAFGMTSNLLKMKTPAAYMKALHPTNKTTHNLTQKRAAKPAAKQASNGLLTFVRSAYCDVCKIDCQSQEVLSKHKLGKKHMKNLQKLQESITPKPANSPAELVTANTSANQSKAVNEQPHQNAGPAAKEDLETKKLKVLSGGAAADAVRVCTCCNVVCNSELVYNFHIAGKKHAAMVKKQQQLQQHAAPVG